MKKIILLLPLIFIFTQTVSAQDMQLDFEEYSQYMNSCVYDNASAIDLVVEIHNTHNSSWDKNNKRRVFQSTLSKDSLFMINRSENFLALNTYDANKVQFFLTGINSKNTNEYEFRVIENQSQIFIPWSTIPKIKTKNIRTRSGIQQMTYLGGYKTTFGNRIIVDIKKTGSNKIISTIVVQWIPIYPILFNIYTANELNEFLKRLQLNGSLFMQMEELKLSKNEIDKWKNQYPANQLDKVSFLPRKLKVLPTDNNLIFYLKSDIKKKDQIEYELIKDQKIVRSWNINEFDNNFIWLKNLKHGEYLLKFRYSALRENVTEYPFVIEPEWYQTSLFKFVIGLLIISYLGFVIYLIPSLRQKHKAKQELAKKEKLQLELKAIYAQLNPHFVFNALSSIQGLINKKDIEGANMYLSDFARLMRDSMTNNNKEQTSLNEEIITLETYLKLEQLRFGFKFDIKTNDVNIFETEIPSLLLQPLIENAVKHGVSSLKEEGSVGLLFSKANNDMIVEIQDNGVGFDIKEVGSGFGLKLTKDRIKLLNQIMNGQSIELHIKGNTPSGTIVSLQFKNWFL